MEIPAGKWCGKCLLCQYNDDDCLSRCNHPKFSPHEVLEDEVHGKIRGIDEDSWRPLRCPACLSAYPNGAVVTITAREVK